MPAPAHAVITVYTDVRIFLELLAPLTAVTDLPTHPTLSRPFTSKALTELVNQARILMQKENAALWKVKPLLTKLVGDNTWAPCGMMIEENDHELFTETARFLMPPTATPNGQTLGESSLRETIVGNQIETAQPPADGQIKGKEKESADEALLVNRDGPTNEESEQNPNPAPESQEHHTNGDQAPGNTDYSGYSSAVDAPNKGPNGTGDVEMAEALSDATANEPQQQARQPANKSNDTAHISQHLNGGIPLNLELLEKHYIHPLFLPPRAAHPDRDIGLPEQEADDVRRILQLYVQKQEEVCRGTKKLYEGLLKADRLRKTVLQWSKAEAHCGPNRDMSDGEDWYDKEEWGITEDLKKGEDEVEEDTAQTQKKTRNRK